MNRKMTTMRFRRAMTAFVVAVAAMGAGHIPAADASSSGLRIVNTDSFVEVRGLYFVLQAKVVDASGNPVQGAPVAFEEVNMTGGPHRLLCKANTDANGWAVCRNAQTLGPVLEHTWTLSYIEGHYDVWDAARGWVGVYPDRWL